MFARHLIRVSPIAATVSVLILATVPFLTAIPLAFNSDLARSLPFEQDGLGKPISQSEPSGTPDAVAQQGQQQPLAPNSYDGDFPERRERWGSWLSSLCLFNAFKPFGNSQHRNTRIETDPVQSFADRFRSSDKLPFDDPHFKGRRLHEIPRYIFDYAPYVYLFSEEDFWPGDIAEHLIHTTPHLDYTPIQSKSQNRTLADLDQLNKLGPRHVYLTSDDNVEDRPDWLSGRENIPERPDDDPGHNPILEPLFRGHRPSAPQHNSHGGYSSAPAVLVAIDKGEGIVDAFWFFFYSYNLGNVVFNVRFGNHIGDWEHTLVRFKDGQPIECFFSEHSWGEAYTYDAVEKIGKRPVVYSAVGTHAMYGTPGIHAYILPWGLLHDLTDRGPLWDPTLNVHAYSYDLGTHNLTFSSSSTSTSAPPGVFSEDRADVNRSERAPTNWFFYRGHWGDKMYPLQDDRQYRFAGQYHYVSGPLGPFAKNLGREAVCQGGPVDECDVMDELYWGPRIWRGPADDDGEEASFQ